MDRLWKEQPADPKCAYRGPSPSNWLAAPGERVEQQLVQWFHQNHPELKYIDLSGACRQARLETDSKKDWRTGAAELTMAALEVADVVYQAPLFDAKLGLFGIADFILRRPAGQDGVHLVIWDAKLALHPRDYFLAQLGAYAEVLDAMVEATECKTQKSVRLVGLVLGQVAAAQGEAHEIDAGEPRRCFRELWARFREFQRRFDPSGQPPDPADSLAGHRGRWEALAQHILAERDDIALVAGMKRDQRRKLRAHGYLTMQSLASLSTAELPVQAKQIGIGKQVLLRFQLQAKLQKDTARQGHVAWEFLPGARAALARLPADDGGDVFLDFEGFLAPPTFAQDYLLGACTQDGAYHDWWAHTAEEGPHAFEEFARWLSHRRQLYPSLHVYHYGMYEQRAVRRIIHASAPANWAIKLEELLRERILVDVLALVRRSLIIGLPSYGLKHVEKLYTRPRVTAVASGMDSLEVYQQWLNKPDGLTWQQSEKLGAIRTYNWDDCNSVRQLLLWLREQSAALQANASSPGACQYEPPDVRQHLEPLEGGEEFEAEHYEAVPGKARDVRVELEKALVRLQKLVAELPADGIQDA